MKRIAILGSTGSIGRSTLDVVRHAPGRFAVAALSAHRSCEELLRQAEARVEKISLDAAGKPAGAEPLDVK